MVKPSVIWPVEHDEALIRLVGERFSFAQVAEKMSRDFAKAFTRNMCCGRAHRLGVTSTVPRKPSKPRPPRIRKGDVTAVGIIGRTERRKPAAQTFAADPSTGLRIADVVPHHLSLLDLEPGQCRWPYGDSNYTFCGCEQFDGTSYCGAHLLLSTGQGTRGEQGAHHLLTIG